jgi:SAM-dependent methyltransferase
MFMNMRSSATVVNVEQAAAWNGYEGQHWAAHQDRYDAVNEEFNGPLLAAARIAPGERILDVGCGNGQLTRLAGAQAGDTGHATGVDLSGPMLQRATASTAASNVTYEQGDAQVHPFPEAAYDVMLSRFGIMFFSDPVAAFGNIHRAVRPGGRLAFLCMRGMADHELGAVLAAMAPHLPGAATDGPGHGGPTSFADPADVDRVLTAAGFRDVTAVATDASQVWGRDARDAAEFIVGWGPIRHMLAGRDPEPARDAAAGALRPFEDGDAVRLRGAAWLVQAVRP